MKEPKFLTVDHLYNDGKIERKTFRTSEMLYAELLRRKALSRRHQILCWNCNQAKYRYGACPHTLARPA
jgi:hypothetical protein